MSSASKARALLEAAQAGADAAQVIFESIEMLESSEKTLKMAIRDLKTAATAVQLVSCDTKKNTSGLGGTGTTYTSERFATAKRREEAAEALLDPKKQKKITFRPALAHIKNRVEQESQRTPKKKQMQTPQTEMGRSKRSASKHSPITFPPSPTIPSPKNGKMYEPDEAARLLAEGVPGVKSSTIISHMIKNKLVPLASIDELKQVVASNTVDAMSMGKKEMASELLDLGQKKAVANGLAISSVSKPCKRSVQNYMIMAAALDSTRTTQHSVYKTDAREVAERSLNSAVSFLGTVASTHFLPATHEDEPSTSEMGVMVAHALGYPVYCIHPACLLNTDDTGLFACEAFKKEQGGGDVFRLCSASEKGDKRSVYNTDAPKFASGLSVKFTCTISAGGTLAPLVAVVNGLTSSELSVASCPSGMLVMEVPGFCIGAGIDIFAEHVGYVVFLREKDEGDDAARGVAYFDWYNDHILDPFVDATRKRFLGWEEGTPIPAQATAVLWTDGGVEQLKAITRQARSERDAVKKIVRNKHAASTSATEQACDVSTSFRNLKMMNKITEIPSAPSLALSAALSKAFASTKGLALKSPKQKILVPFLSSVPSMFTKSFSPKTITDGFLDTGLISPGTPEPNLSAIVNTCKRRLTQEEDALIHGKFGPLVREAVKNGMVNDDWLLREGFPVDQKVTGEVVVRDSDSEHHQRSKCLTHEVSVRVRRDAIESIQRARVAKEQSEIDKALALLKKNSDAEAALAQLTEDPSAHSTSTCLAGATPQHFEKLNVDQLKAFIHVREFGTTTIPRGSWTWLSKGKASQAEENLISQAFARRSQSLKLVAPLPVVASNSVNAAAAEPEFRTPLTIKI